jgi:hypothetical protein
MRTTDRVAVGDLSPSARELLGARDGSALTRRRRALLWLVVGAVAAAFGRRIVAWLDRNL